MCDMECGEVAASRRCERRWRVLLDGGTRRVASRRRPAMVICAPATHAVQLAFTQYRRGGGLTSAVVLEGCFRQERRVGGHPAVVCRSNEWSRRGVWTMLTDAYSSRAPLPFSAST